MNLVPHQFLIEGISPVLMHSPAGMVGAGDDTTLKSRTKIPSPQEEAERGLYRLPGGQLYIPAIAFKNGMLGASKGRRVKALKMTARDALSGACFTVDGRDRCPLMRQVTLDPIMDLDEIDTRRAVIPSSGAAVMRSRGLIRNWCCVIDLEIDEDLITAEFVLELFTLAGTIRGVLDYRPECDGPFGRYRVKLLTEPLDMPAEVRTSARRK
jgi:hypothetical protein